MRRALSAWIGDRQLPSIDQKKLQLSPVFSNLHFMFASQTIMIIVYDDTKAGFRQ
jgi:hypothetical protein